VRLVTPPSDWKGDQSQLPGYWISRDCISTQFSCRTEVQYHDDRRDLNNQRILSRTAPIHRFTQGAELLTTKNNWGQQGTRVMQSVQWTYDLDIFLYFAL
jgi:hypothetical protein